MLNRLLRRLTLQRTLLLLPLVFIIALTATVGLTVRGIAEQETTGSVINVAGRQRMLNQRQMKEVQVLLAGGERDYQATRALLLDSLSALLDGGEIVTNPATGATAVLPRLESPEIRDLLTAQGDALQAVFAASDEVLALDADSPEFTSTLNEMLELGDAAHAVANDAVLALSAESRTAINGVVRDVVVIAIIVGLLGTVFSYLIARTVTRNVRKGVLALAKVSDELTDRSISLGGESEEAASQAAVVAESGAQVSESTNMVAAALEEFSASIQEIAGNAAEANQVANDAVGRADGASTSVSELSDSSAEIGKVLEVITSIAEQTNLLALNATIEAARAGEAGKGFAVVANEVKELAKETAKATEEISTRISKIQSDTDGASGAIAEVAEIISRIAQLQAPIASAVEEQTAVTSQISENVADAARGAADISDNVKAVAEAARGTSQSAAAVSRNAGAVEQVAAELRALVERAHASEAGRAHTSGPSFDEVGHGGYEADAHHDERVPAHTA